MRKGWYWVMIDNESEWMPLEYDPESDLFYTHGGNDSFEVDELFLLGAFIPMPKSIER